MTSDLENRFTYHAPKPGQAERYEALRAAGLAFARFIDSQCPDSREKSSALTKVDEAVMHANAAIARRE